MINMLKNLHQEESGQDLIEYGLLALFIALACITIVPTIGNKVASVFSKVNTDLT